MSCSAKAFHKANSLCLTVSSEQRLLSYLKSSIGFVLLLTLSFATTEKRMYTITINLNTGRSEQRLVENVAAGQTLLEVCQQNNIALPFTCGGVCSCSTCHIEVRRGHRFVDEMTRREKDFIKRIHHTTPASRLACQCLLLDEEGEIEITIPNTLEPSKHNV